MIYGPRLIRYKKTCRFSVTQWLFCRTTCMQYGHCQMKTPIFQPAGNGSKRGFPKLSGSNHRADRANRQRAKLAFGNGGFGKIAFEMTRITKTTCHIARVILSNTDMWKRPKRGNFRWLTATSAKETCGERSVGETHRFAFTVCEG